MKFLFVGGPEHGKIKDIRLQGDTWEVAVIPPVTDILYNSSPITSALEGHRFLYYKKDIILFDERLTFLSIDNRQDGPRVLDAILKPEVRDLMRRFRI